MTSDYVAVVGLILFLVASVVVNDDGQLWRLHKMGLPHATIHVHMIFHYIYINNPFGVPIFFGNPDALLQQC